MRKSASGFSSLESSENFSDTKSSASKEIRLDGRWDWGGEERGKSNDEEKVSYWDSGWLFYLSDNGGHMASE